MAIKVKHSGSAASAGVASAKGGRGRRRLEEAAKMMQLALQAEQQGLNAHTSGGGFVQAHAAAPSAGGGGGGGAPLVTAHAGGGGGGGGGSAPLISAPTPNTHRAAEIEAAGRSSPVTSPGGFKKSGRMGGATGGGYDVVNQSGNDIVQWDAKEKVYKVGGKKFSKAQVEAIVKRGDSGATLSNADLAVYQHYNHDVRGIRTQAEIAAGVQVAKEARAAQEWDRQQKIKEAAEEKKRKAVAEENEKKRQNAIEVAKIRAEAVGKAQAAKDAKKDEAEEQWNERYGVDTGTRLSLNEKKDIEQGRKVWGYTQNDQRAVDEINAEYDEAVATGMFNEDELGRLGRTRDDRLAGFRKRLIANPNTPTVEQVIATAKENGGYYYDASGNLRHISELTASEKRDRSIEDKQRSYILDSIDKQRKAWQVKRDKYDETDDGEREDKKLVDPGEFDLKGAYEQALGDWNTVVNSGNAPSSAPVGGGAGGDGDPAPVIKPLPGGAGDKPTEGEDDNRDWHGLWG